jgi:acetate kinase
MSKILCTASDSYSLSHITEASNAAVLDTSYHTTAIETYLYFSVNITIHQYARIVFDYFAGGMNEHAIVKKLSYQHGLKTTPKTICRVLSSLRESLSSYIKEQQS